MTMIDEPSNPRKYAVIAILFLINLLNYMDRYTVAGVLTQIQDFYDLDDSTSALIQTIFVVAFMVFSPIFGFLGDRYNRKWIMIAGISVWVLAVLASSFIPSDKFLAFLLLRGVVGIGETSYITICPSVIADIFIGRMRSRMLMIFFFAIPVGSGLGYMVGSKVSSAMGSWQWGIRLTSVLGVICLCLISIFVYEPERGSNERKSKGTLDERESEQSFWKDLKALTRIPTYLFSTFGYTAIVFCTGTLAFWGPTAVTHSVAAAQGLNSTEDLPKSEKDSIAFKFGVVTMVGGIVGVALGSILSECLRNGRLFFRCCRTARGDPIVCALGAAVAVPSLFLGLYIVETSMDLCYLFIFLCVTGLCFNWAINVDMLMSFIVPSRRNIAHSLEILASHLFGDASGPYIVGLISDSVRGEDLSPTAHYKALKTAFYLPNVICLAAVVLFLLSSITLLRDQRRFAIEMNLEKAPDEDDDFSEIKLDDVESEESNLDEYIKF